MARLQLFLLGTTRIELDGRPIEVDTRKAVALMAYLAVTGERHSREAIAALFWPDADQRRAHAALRRTLSALNKALAGVGVQIERDSISARPADLWMDVAEFRRLAADCRARGRAPDDISEACLRSLAEAAALHRGDFLAGFTLRDSPGFDEWQFFHTESLRRELAGVLERLAGAHSARGDYESAIGYARRWLALDPLHEPAHRQLIRLYAWTNQRAAALRQFHECARVLNQELGVAPLEETVLLAEAVKEQRLPPPLAGPPSTPAPEPAEPRPARPPALPLVGREDEWTALWQRYERLQSDGVLLVVEGEAGIGKTRLAEAFLDEARRRGAVVAAARCYEGESSLAYGPFVETLRAAARPGAANWAEAVPDHWLSEAARLLPELAALRPNLPAPAPLDGPGAQSRFFEGVSQALLRVLAGQAPGVLFLDDLHWADEASLDLLTYLVRRLGGRPLCVVAAWRSEETPATRRLRQLALDAGRQGLALHLSLARLNQAAVAELVRRSLPGRPAGLSERLYRESEGLPLFVTEYLAALANSPSASAPDAWTLPAGVRDLLESRLAAVSETGRQLLSAAAAIGRSFDFETLQTAGGRTAEETVAGLEALIALGLVREVGGEEAAPLLLYDFGHEKLRALVYEETSLARRRLLHQRIAETLAQRARWRRGLPAGAGQIAEHYRLGGRAGEAAQFFRLAGEHARSLYANLEALAHFQAALALGPQSDEDIAALHEAVGDLQTLAGDYPAALAAYAAAAARRPAEELAGLEHKVGGVYHRRGEWDLAEKHFAAALAALAEATAEGAASIRARISADWSLTAHQRGQPERAAELARQALELAEQAADTRALAQAHNILGILASSRGDFAEARGHLARSLAQAEALGDLGARVAALNNLALAQRRSGALAEALALTEQALALCASQGDRHREAALRNNLADLLHEAGQGEAAMAHLKQAVALFAEIGTEAGDWQPEVWKLTEW